MSFSDDETGARRKKPAALGRDGEVLAARRSLAVVVPAQERRRGDGRSSSGVRGSDVDKVRGGMECHAFSDGATADLRWIDPPQRLVFGPNHPFMVSFRC